MIDEMWGELMNNYFDNYDEKYPDLVIKILGNALLLSRWPQPREMQAGIEALTDKSADKDGRKQL